MTYPLVQCFRPQTSTRTNRSRDIAYSPVAVALRPEVLHNEANNNQDFPETVPLSRSRTTLYYTLHCPIEDQKGSKTGN